MTHTVVIFSGGPDSTIAALEAAREGGSVELLTLQFKGKEQYGELRSAIRVAEAVDLPHTIIDFRSPLSGFEGHWHIMMHADDPVRSPSSSQLLPFGAGLVLAMSTTYALSVSASRMVWGAIRDDAVAHRDYSKDFADAFASLVELATGKHIEIALPNANKWKPQVLAAFRLVPELFALTWSCKYPKTANHCGRCAACVARRSAAYLAGIDDITKYETTSFINPQKHRDFGSSDTMDWTEYANMASDPFPG